MQGTSALGYASFGAFDEHGRSRRLVVSVERFAVPPTSNPPFSFPPFVSSGDYVYDEDIPDEVCPEVRRFMGSASWFCVAQKARLGSTALLPSMSHSHYLLALKSHASGL